MFTRRLFGLNWSSIFDKVCHFIYIGGFYELWGATSHSRQGRKPLRTRTGHLLFTFSALLIIASSSEVHLMSLEVNKTCSISVDNNNNSGDNGLGGGTSGGVPIFWGGHTGSGLGAHTNCRGLIMPQGHWLSTECAYMVGHGRANNAVYPINQDDLWLMGMLSSIHKRANFSSQQNHRCHFFHLIRIMPPLRQILHRFLCTMEENSHLYHLQISRGIKSYF